MPDPKELQAIVDKFCNGMFSGHACIYRDQLLEFAEEVYQLGRMDESDDRS